MAIGSCALMAAEGVAPALEDAAARLEEQGRTVTFVAALEPAPALLGLIAAMDALKPTAVEAVRRLQTSGIETVLLTGDNARTAQSVARTLGIARVLAEMLPNRKAAEMTHLQGEGGSPRSAME